VTKKISADLTCDVLVIGAGAGGLSSAITARKGGLDVIVIEKAPVLGGTTAFSGGVLWIPDSDKFPNLSSPDNRSRATEYLKHETGNFYDEAMISAFLDHGPEMLAFFERETEVKFVPTLYPDYHPDAPGGVDIGRSVLAAPYNAAALGDDLALLRKPLATITFMGMMFNSSNADIKHFFNATKSVTSFLYVARRLAAHFKDMLLYRRGVEVTSGNALAARLIKSARDAGVALYTETPAEQLVWEDARVGGAVVKAGGALRTITARRGVVLATGGFAHDAARVAVAYPHVRLGGQHLSPVPAENTGDGLRLAEAVGGHYALEFPNAAAWMPVSAVPMPKNETAVFPHLLDRYKPGVIAVNINGERFTNESNSYHDVGEAMIANFKKTGREEVYLIADARAIRKYGLGFAKPAPLPLRPHLRSGYLKMGRTIRDLAGAIGVDAAKLETTIARYNEDARTGQDLEFHRGATTFNRYLGDADNMPNPTVAPLTTAPFYAVRLLMGDLGTFDGLKTTVNGQVLNAEGATIDGLYAVGNDRASIMSGRYPGAGITLGPIMTFGYLTGRHLAGG